jgi:hypothetical protein
MCKTRFLTDNLLLNVKKLFKCNFVVSQLQFTERNVVRLSLQYTLCCRIKATIQLKIY